MGTGSWRSESNGKRPKSGSGGDKIIPFDEWQWERDGEHQYGVDEATGERWATQDTWMHKTVRYEEPITKADALKEIMQWTEGKFDDLPADTYVWVDYTDGTHFASHEGDIDDGERARSRFSKSGIMGITFENGDYTLVWGKEFDRDGNKVPIMTRGDEDEGIAPRSNVFSGYKVTEEWYVREKVYRDRRGYVTRRERLAESTHNYPDRVWR